MDDNVEIQNFPDEKPQIPTAAGRGAQSCPRTIGDLTVTAVFLVNMLEHVVTAIYIGLSIC